MTTADAPLLDLALAALAAGLSVVPPREDGSKRPLGEWKRYETERPTEAQVRSWYVNGRQGIGFVCGAVSGNLESLDFDHGGKPVWSAFTQRCHERGVGELLDRVIAGYAERTPRGDGVHLLYRCAGPVDGNLKLARRPATDAEIEANPGDPVKVIFETRGEGGYIVVAPSGGTVHPTGQPWLLLRGGFDQIATITAEERQALLDVARSFDELGEDEPATPAIDPVLSELEAMLQTSTNASPNDGPNWMAETVASFNRATTWAEILQPHGWAYSHRAGSIDHWRRPGKDRDHSATTNANGTDKLILWSSSVAIPGIDTATGHPAPNYDRFSVWAGYEHGGNRAEAAVAARKAGHGPPWEEHERIDVESLIAPPTPAVPAEWEDPLALDGPPPPPYPLDVLPGWIGDHCAVVADRLQVPVDLCGQLALGVLAAVAMKKVAVRVTPEWVEPCNLYLTTVMASGSGKSPASRAMVRPLRKLEDELLELHASTCHQAEVERKVAEKRAQKAMEAASREGGDLQAALTAAAAADAIEVPPVPRLLASNATPEALKGLLDAHGGRIALVSSEAELYDLVLGIYGSRVDLTPYLCGWDGEPIIDDRKGGSGTPGTKYNIKEPLLTISITVQPAALEALRSKPELAGRGFVQRFCYAWPASLVGQRTWDPDADLTIPTAPEWERRILDIGRRLATWNVAAHIPFDTRARKLFFAWRQDLEGRLAAEDDEQLATFVSKLTGSVARTAALFHVADGSPITGDGALVDEQTVARAIEMGDYWLAHADSVWLQFGTDGSLSDARAVLGWLRRDKPAAFRKTDVYLAHRRRFTSASAAESAVRTLAEHGWIRPAADGKKQRKDNPSWEPHPQVIA